MASRIEERQQARLLRRVEAKGTLRGSKSHPVREIETQHIRDNRGFRSQVQAAGTTGASDPRYKLQGQQGRQVPGTKDNRGVRSQVQRTAGASGPRYKLQDNRGVRFQVLQ